jgi:phage N-6-adenine-methyltransferase
MNDLTIYERTELENCEVVIEHGLRTFVEVGISLSAIRDGRLYRATHGTFEDYCKERWTMERAHAYRLMDGAQVIYNLSPIGDIQLPATESQARPLTRLDPVDQPIIWQRAVETAPNGRVTAAHVQNVVEEYTRPAVSGTPGYDGDEWYTPLPLIEAARAVMGEIDFDPASNPIAQQVVKAHKFCTKEDDSLRDGCEWTGKIWLNPPYSTPLIQFFVKKLISQYEIGNVEAAIILVNNSTDTRWFHELLERYPACFTRGRVQFWRTNSEVQGARQGQTLFYFGQHEQRFVEKFAPLGKVVKSL